MSTLRKEMLIWVRLVLPVSIWIAVILLSGKELRLDWDAVKKLPDAVTVYMVLTVVFTKWAWRWTFFRGWLVQTPDLQGTWKGSLRSTWVNPATGEAVPETKVTLVVKQTFSTISIVMYTDESDSFSTTAQINEDDESGVYRLTYNYANRPRATIRTRSAMHDGAAILKVVLKPRRELQGEYWTSRKTTGELSVSFESKKLAQKHGQ